MAMNPWLAADLIDERVRDLRAAVRHPVQKRPTTDTGTAEVGTRDRVSRPSLARRATRALRGHRLRPA